MKNVANICIAFMLDISYIKILPGFRDYDLFISLTQRFEKIMRAVQGALIVASTLQIVLGFSGLWRNVAR